MIVYRVDDRSSIRTVAERSNHVSEVLSQSVCLRFMSANWLKNKGTIEISVGRSKLLQRMAHQRYAQSTLVRRNADRRKEDHQLKTVKSG
jgi:hypothetical protein